MYVFAHGKSYAFPFSFMDLLFLRVWRARVCVFVCVHLFECLPTAECFCFHKFDLISRVNTRFLFVGRSLISGFECHTVGFSVNNFLSCASFKCDYFTLNNENIRCRKRTKNHWWKSDFDIRWRVFTVSFHQRVYFWDRFPSIGRSSHIM